MFQNVGMKSMRARHVYQESREDRGNFAFRTFDHLLGAPGLACCSGRVAEAAFALRKGIKSIVGSIPKI